MLLSCLFFSSRLLKHDFLLVSLVCAFMASTRLMYTHRVHGAGLSRDGSIRRCEKIDSSRTVNRFFFSVYMTCQLQSAQVDDIRFGQRAFAVYICLCYFEMMHSETHPQHLVWYYPYFCDGGGKKTLA